MTDLRLVLLLAGALALALVWLLDVRRERKAQRQRMVLRQRQANSGHSGAREAGRDGDQSLDQNIAGIPPISPSPDYLRTEPEPALPAAPEFIAIHVKSAHQTPFVTQAVFAAAESAGLVHGDQEIFHMPGATRGGAPLFSMANLLEPGTFSRADPTRTTRGLTLIMRLPAESNPAMVLDLMLQTAELLATSLGGMVYGTDHRALDKERTAALRRQAAAGTT